MAGVINRHRAWFTLGVRLIGILTVLRHTPMVANLPVTLMGWRSDNAMLVDERYLGGPVTHLLAAYVGDLAAFGLGLFLVFGAGGLISRCLGDVRFVCSGCGYNLRGATGTVCPECGTPRELPPALLSAGVAAPVAEMNNAPASDPQTPAS